VTEKYNLTLSVNLR